MKPILVFQSDFTYKRVRSLRHVWGRQSVDRKLEIIDGTHELHNLIPGRILSPLPDHVLLAKGNHFCVHCRSGVGTKQ